MNCVRETQDGVTIDVRVQPGAKKSRVVGLHGDSLKIAVAAPPVDGKANEALQIFVAELLGVRRVDVELVRGETSRQKTIFVRRLSVADVVGHIETILK